MRNLERRSNQSETTEPAIPNFIAKPLGIKAFKWTLDHNRESNEPITAPRIAGGVFMGATEFFLPALGRSTMRSRMDNVYWNEDEEIARPVCGTLLDIASLAGAFLIYKAHYDATLDQSFALSMATTSKIGLNTLIHFIIDGFKKSKG